MSAKVAEALTWRSSDDNIRVGEYFDIVNVTIKTMCSKVCFVSRGSVLVNFDGIDGYESRLNKTLRKPSRSGE